MDDSPHVGRVYVNDLEGRTVEIDQPDRVVDTAIASTRC